MNTWSWVEAWRALLGIRVAGYLCIRECVSITFSAKVVSCADGQ